MRPSPRGETKGATSDSPLRMLLIEDSSSDSDLILALLETELPRADIDVAANLEDAMIRLRETRYEVVLTDLSLPDAEGPAVVHAVRASYPDTALLVLTGRVDGELALWALAEGAQDYLVKGQHDGPRLATALLHALHRQRAEHDAHRYLQLARGLLDAIEAPTCAVDAGGNIVAVNDAWLAFTNAPASETSAWGVGVNYLQRCDVEVGAGTVDAKTVGLHAAGLLDVLSGEVERHQHEYPRQYPDEERWYSVRISPVQIDDERGAVLSHVDVTDMHRVQQALVNQSLHDSLTSLPNRLLMTDRLTQALADGQRRGRNVGVAFLDLDQFKRINDTLGHSAGDLLLQQVARRLADQMRSADTLSRFSGDEFVVIWRDLSGPDDARILSERLATSLVEPFDLDGTRVTVSASIGVIVGRPCESADELLMAADAAMYDAKRRGGGHVRMFSDELRRDAEENAATEVALRAAVLRSELVVHYQPVMELVGGTPVAVEALVRWEHPERGLLGPQHFIPVAEASGLIVDLGRWVLDRACRDAVAFTGPARGLDVAVNLSARQLTQPGVVDHVRRALAQSGLPPNRLMLEVTESAVMEDGESAAVALDALHALGVRIAIDDFGTGYSSLLYLRRYPITALKLDRAFVSGLGVHLNDDAICRNVVTLAHAVGATSIAEGVETTEQYAALRADACMQAQGYLWSPAVPLAELGQALTRAAAVPVPALPDRTRSILDVAPLDPAVAGQLETLRASGASPHSIAAALNGASAPSPSGARWSAVSVRRYLAAGDLRRAVPGPGAPRPRVAPDPPLVTQRGQLDDAALLDRVGTYLTGALRGSDPCLVIATPEHRDSLRRRLADNGLGAVLDTDLYVERDAIELLEIFMRDGRPVPALFAQALDPLLDRPDHSDPLRVYGELAECLSAVGNIPGAFLVEALWKTLEGRNGVTLLPVPNLTALVPSPQRESTRG